MKLKEWINVFVILLLLGISYYRFTNQTHTARRTKVLLDTQVEIFITSKSKDVNNLIEQAFSMIEAYELKFSYYNPKSVLYQINQESVSTRHDICEDFYNILRLAEMIYHESNHLYDVTIANLFDIWDFENEIVPSREMIEAAQQNIGFEHIRFGENYLYKPLNIRLNFGSLAKGYIIDKVMEFLIENGVREAFINAGGDLRFFSNNGRRWRIGIQHPRNIYTTIAVLNIPDMAVTTTGDYERYFIKDGRRYHHIINPKTGFPAQPNVSVTVFSKSAFMADALSTAAFVMNPFDAIEMIKLFENTEAIIYFYDENKEPVSLKTENIRRWLVSEQLRELVYEL